MQGYTLYKIDTLSRTSTVKGGKAKNYDLFITVLNIFSQTNLFCVYIFLKEEIEEEEEASNKLKCDHNRRGERKSIVVNQFIFQRLPLHLFKIGRNWLNFRVSFKTFPENICRQVRSRGSEK